MLHCPAMGSNHFQKWLAVSKGARFTSPSHDFGQTASSITHTLANAIFACIFGTVLLVPSGVVHAEFETQKGWNGHLFPSFIIATATATAPEKPNSEDAEENDESVLGDPQGLLGITIEADEDDQPIKVTITCDPIMQPSSFSCTLPKSGETYTINPKIKYKYDDLAKRSQTGPVTVTYKVEVGDEEAEESTEILTLRSVNDCPYSVAKDGKWRSVRFMFAAYVNEQHPFADKILREALDTEVVNSFTGYQTAKASEVYRQAYALWHALSNRDVRYSNITKCVAISDTVGSQHIRLIDQSINNAQANCVDGSVLMASLLRKVDIEPILVHVPGHCYLAFLLDADGKELVGLETTMIGGLIEGDAMKVKGLENVVDEDFQSENSWKTFSAAVATGTANLKKYQKNFQDTNNYNYQLISVVAARKSGILPIGFQSNQKFIEASNDADGASDDGDEDSDSEK